MSMDPNIWVETLPKSKKNLKEENYDLNANKWINSIPKKRTNFSKIKYSFTILLFVSSLLAVPLIKNETRKLQKEINNLQVSINDIKVDLHQEALDYEVITSPENIYRLAEEYLENDLIFYSKNQIKKLNKEDSILSLKQEINNEKKFFNKTYKVTNKIKNEMVKTVKEKKENIKKVQQLYSEPEKLPSEIKSQVSKKIQNTKSSIKSFYNDPIGSVDKDRIQQWAAVQVVKVFLGMPIIPGK